MNHRKFGFKDRGRCRTYVGGTESRRPYSYHDYARHKGCRAGKTNHTDPGWENCGSVMDRKSGILDYTPGRRWATASCYAHMALWKGRMMPDE